MINMWILKPDESGKNNHQQDAGFTLLEVMVAVSIIAIVLVSVYKMHTQTISMNYTARFNSIAPLLAQEKIAQYEIKSANELVDDSGDFGDELPGYKWSVAAEDVESDVLGIVADDLKKINVTISCNEDEFTFSSEAYRLFR